MLLFAEIDLGDLLIAMVVFFYLFLAIWVFIALFADIFRRRDLSGWGKAGWILLIFLFPLIGALIYVLARPPEAAQVPAREYEERTRPPS
jgi:uncharacterized membrane protein YhaH (DUF805 family)